MEAIMICMSQEKEFFEPNNKHTICRQDSDGVAENNDNMAKAEFEVEVKFWTINQGQGD